MDSLYASVNIQGLDRFESLKAAFALHQHKGLIHASIKAVSAFLTRTVLSVELRSNQLQRFNEFVDEKLDKSIFARRVEALNMPTFLSSLRAIESGSGGFPYIERALSWDVFLQPKKGFIEQFVSFFLRAHNVIKVEKEEASRADTPSFKVKAHVFENSIESFNAKKEAIKKAERSIVFSGHLCQGKAFIEVLDLIEKRLNENANLKVLIIGHSLVEAFRKNPKVAKMTEQFGVRFQAVQSDCRWIDADGLRVNINHVKAFVVDEKISIMGGSYIEDQYAYNAGDGAGWQQDYSPVEYDCITKDFYQSVVNRIFPKAFRDMDFQIEGSGFGSRLAQQLCQLARNISTYRETDHPILQSEALPSFEIVDDEEIKSSAMIFCSGPENGDDGFNQALEEAVGSAQQRIVFDHMYFHPTPRLTELLVARVKAGVSLDIVTNGYESFSPKGCMLFGLRNRYEWKSVLSALTPEERDRVQVYEYGRGEKNLPFKTILHKKVIVVDDSVFMGSGNLSAKMQHYSSDYEINAKIDSHELADATTEVIMQDAYKIMRSPLDDEGNQIGKPLPLSREMDVKSANTTFQEWLCYHVHKQGGFFFG